MNCHYILFLFPIMILFSLFLFCTFYFNRLDLNNIYIIILQKMEIYNQYQLFLIPIMILFSLFLSYIIYNYLQDLSNINIANL